MPFRQGTQPAQSLRVSLEADPNVTAARDIRIPNVAGATFETHAVNEESTETCGSFDAYDNTTIKKYVFVSGDKYDHAHS